MAKRVLMVLTNHNFIEGTSYQTGWFLAECAHPYFRFAKAGYQIDFASIKGGFCPVSEHSIQLDKSDEGREFLNNSELRALTDSTKAIKDCDPKNYDLVFFVGGFGVMWDFPFDGSLATFTQQIYEQGGVVGAVCHGPIALANVKLSNGDYLIANKEVTAFCNEEEEFANVQSNYPEHFGLGRTCEDVFLARGARFTKGPKFNPHIAISDRLFTGQNPSSAGCVADAIVAALSP